MKNEIERSTGSAATVNVTVITCGGCGRAVTPAIPWEGKGPLLIEASVECPECAGKAKAQLAEANERADKWQRAFNVRCQQADERDGAISDQFTLLANAEHEARERAEKAEARLAEANGVIDANRWPDTAAKLLREAESRAEAAEAHIKELEAQLAEANSERDQYHKLYYQAVARAEVWEDKWERADERAEAAEARLAEANERAERYRADYKNAVYVYEIAEAGRKEWQTLAEQSIELGKKAEARVERLEAALRELDSINGQLQGLIRTVRGQLNDLLLDEDLDDEKLREASDGLLPSIVDRLTAALAPDAGWPEAKEGSDESASQRD